MTQKGILFRHCNHWIVFLVQHRKTVMSYRYSWLEQLNK